jgi:hypothetical protein
VLDETLDERFVITAVVLEGRSQSEVARAYGVLRHDVVDAAGKVTLRVGGRLLHIGVGRTHARTPSLCSFRTSTSGSSTPPPENSSAPSPSNPPAPTNPLADRQARRTKSGRLMGVRGGSYVLREDSGRGGGVLFQDIVIASLKTS